MFPMHDEFVSYKIITENNLLIVLLTSTTSWSRIGNSESN